MRYRRIHHALVTGCVVAVFGLLTACGSGERDIPKEETGEPNTLPAEVILYRDARDTFLRWTEVFSPQPALAQAFPLLSGASKRQLRAQGITDAQSFADWFLLQASAQRAPFHYTFSRFDILDIDVQDTTRAIITATFLVHLNQKSFESVGSFILRRERGRWTVPFVQENNYESGWWEKEKNFAMRISEEGLARLTSTRMSLSMRYPVAWDIVSRDRARIPTHQSPLPGMEIQYIDPATLSPIAFARIAILPGPLPDSLRVLSDSTAPLRLLRNERITSDQGKAVDGELRLLADPSQDRFLLFYSGVDAAVAEYDRFAETFAAMRKSLAPTSEVVP